MNDLLRSNSYSDAKTSKLLPIIRTAASVCSSAFLRRTASGRLLPTVMIMASTRSRLLAQRLNPTLSRSIDVQLGPILLDILDQQLMEGALIITSQYPPEKWYELFGDPTVADAILDRVVHRAHAISLKGESMRKLRAKKIS